MRSLPENARGRFRLGTQPSHPNTPTSNAMNQDPNTESGAYNCPPPEAAFEYEDPFAEVKTAQDDLDKDKKRFIRKVLA